MSYEVQRQAVLELASRIGDPEPEIIEERGRSGADARNGSWGTGRGGKRRAWGELRERIQAGEGSALYAYSLSRLARSIPELRALMGDCDQAGVRVRLTKEGTLDFGTASGRFTLNMLGALAEFEADVASERVREAHAVKRERGEVVNQLPYGWKKGEDNKPEPDPEAQAVIRKAKAALEQQGTLRGAARELNAQGVPSPKGRAWNGESIGLVVAGTDADGRRKKSLAVSGRHRAQGSSSMTTTSATASKRPNPGAADPRRCRPYVPRR